MKSHKQDGRIQEMLHNLETTLETYLEAWRREFGIKEGSDGATRRDGPRFRERRDVLTLRGKR